MADIDLKTETPDTTINDSAFLFGADSQSAASPSVYSVATVKGAIIGAGSVSVASTKTLTANNTLTLTGTDGSSVAFGTGGTVAYTNATANGKSLARFTPLDNQPPASNFATLDTRNSVALLDFDDATDEAVVFVGVISQGAILTSGIMVRIFWAASTATSGDCVWSAEFEDTSGHDIDSDGFDTATTATTTTSGTSGVVNVTEITCTTIDSLSAGDAFRVKISRDANNGSDTMTGDAELVAVELQQVA
jgi:hypothetical protein